MVLSGTKYTFDVSRTEKNDIDKDALRVDGLFEKYNTKSVVTYRLTNKRKGA